MASATSVAVAKPRPRGSKRRQKSRRLKSSLQQRGPIWPAHDLSALRKSAFVKHGELVSTVLCACLSPFLPGTMSGRLTCALAYFLYSPLLASFLLDAAPGLSDWTRCIRISGFASD